MSLKLKGRLGIAAVMALVVQVLMPFLSAPALAVGTFSKTLVRFDRMQTSQGTTGTVCLAPTVTTAIAHVKVTYPSSFSTSTTTGNWGVNATSTNMAWPSGASALTGASSVSAVSGATGGTVTFDVSPAFTPTATTLYCFNWTTAAGSTVTQPGSANPNENGTVVSQNSTPADIDSGDYSTATIAGDQVSVTATVAPDFTFTLQNTNDAFGTLSSSSVNSSQAPKPVATVSTNAKNGWQAWGKDANTGVRSTNAAHTIASTTPGTNSTISGGTEGFNTGVAGALNNTGSDVTCSGVTIPATFVNGAGQGGGLNTNFQTIGTCDGTSNGATLTMTNHITISPATSAASDYSDLETIVAAGLF